MLHTTRTILANAGIFAAILDHDMAYVNMTNYISMHRDVLSDHKSVERRWIQREEEEEEEDERWKQMKSWH